MKATTNNNRIAPPLRFNDFNGQWQKFELGKLTRKISVGIATEVRPFVSQKGDVPLIRNQNIKAGYFDDSSMEYITPKFDEANKTKRVQSGDVIIVRTGSNMGNACVVPERFKGSQTFTTLIVRPNSDLLHFQFLSYHINYFGLSEIQRLSAGGGKPNLNAGVLKDYRITIGTEPEQQKIASFLSAVDQKIQLLTRKKELLDQYKKGVMQQLFSGKLRFKDENGKAYPKWEEKRLGEIGNTYNGLTGKTAIDFGQGKPYIQYKQIFDNSRIIVQNCGFVQINSDEYQQKVQYGDVLFTTSSETPHEIGFSSVLLNETKEMYLNSFCFGFRPNSLKELNPQFARYLFRNELFRRIIIKLAQGSTRYNMSKVELMKLKITLPTEPEQQKMANFLSSIDTKIENVTTQITQTQTFKKGLLQQMFV